MEGAAYLRLHRGLRLLLALVVTGLLASQLVPWPVSGASAYLTSLHLGLEPRPILIYPLQRALLRRVADLPWGSLGMRVNGFSLVCTLASLMLFHQLVFRFYGGSDLRQRPWLCAVCAALATWVAASSTALWWIGSRSAPLSFHLLLTMVCVWLFTGYLRDRKPAFLDAFAFVYGVCLAEHSAFLLMAPLAGAWTLNVMLRRGHLTARRLARLAGWALLGALVSLPAAWAFHQSAARQLTAFDSFGHTYRAYGSSIVRGALQGVPKTGWLLVLVVSGLPFLCCLWSAYARSEIRKEKRVHFAVMNAALAVVALVVLADGPVSPWRILGEWHLVGLPYLLVAVVLGYAVGFGYQFPEGIWKVKPRTVALVRRGVLALTVPICFLPLHNAPAVSARATEALWAVAEETARWLEGRDLLLAQGQESALLRLAAYEQGRPLTLLLPAAERNEIYQRHLKTVFTEPRLQMLAEVSLLSALKEVLATRPDVAARLACMGNSGLLTAFGYVPVPHGPVYVGVKEPSTLDPERLVQEHEAMWSRLLPVLQPESAGAFRLRVVASRWYLSRLANDLGVLLQFVERDDLAAGCYARALEANAENVCARLNLAALDGRERPELWQEAAARLEKVRMPLQQLVLVFGHLRSPETIEFLKEIWTAPGSEGAAASADPEWTELQARMGRGELESALAMTDAMVERTPVPPEVWWVRGLLAERLQRDDVWVSCYARMRELQQEWPMFLMIEGRRRLAAGEREGARALLARAADLWPGNPAILQAVLELDFAAGRSRETREAARRLLAADPSHEAANRILGLLDLREGRMAQAETALRATADLHPSAANLNNLAWLQRAVGRTTEALETARKALALDPVHVPTLDTYAVLLLDEGKTEAARAVLDQIESLHATLPELPVRRVRLALAEGDRSAAEAWMARADALEPPLSEDLARELQELRAAAPSAR